MFTQKHYEAIAKILKETRIELSREFDQEPPSAAGYALDKFQYKLHKLFREDNPKFKEFLFIGAASEHTPPDSEWPVVYTTCAVPECRESCVMPDSKLCAKHELWFMTRNDFALPSSQCSWRELSLFLNRRYPK